MHASCEPWASPVYMQGSLGLERVIDIDLPLPQGSCHLLRLLPSLIFSLGIPLPLKCFTTPTMHPSPGIPLDGPAAPQESR